jgi:hypothetical protein
MIQCGHAGTGGDQGGCRAYRQGADTAVVGAGTVNNRAWWSGHGAHVIANGESEACKFLGSFFLETQGDEESAGLSRRGAFTEDGVGSKPCLLGAEAL